MKLKLLFLGVLILCTACGHDDSAPPPASVGTTNGSSSTSGVPTGLWGGEGIQLTVTNAGATYILGCATGTIDQPIAPDTSGNFQNTGTLTPGPGPIVTPPPPPTPATYSGTANGNAMTLTINVVVDGLTVSQKYQLQFGATGHIIHCE